MSSTPAADDALPLAMPPSSTVVDVPVEPARAAVVVTPATDAPANIPPTVVTPVAPRRRRNFKPFLLFLATFVCLMVLRGLTAVPSADIPYRNPDEHLMFTVGMSTLTGGPGNTLGWPGGPMRLATAISMPVLFSIENRGHLSIDSWVTFVGHELRNPWRMVQVLRWWSIALSSLGFAFLPLILTRYTRSHLTAFTLAIAALSGGTLWVRSVMCTGDAVGWATSVVAIWMALRARESQVNWSRWACAAALFAGLATASKVTSVYLWPFVFVCSIRSWSTLWKTPLIWLFLPLVGHYLLNPYLFTDPIRVAKAIGGNLLTRPPSSPFPASLFVGVPVVWLILAVLAAPFALVRRQWWLLIATVWCLAMYAMTLRGTAMIDPHYLTPLAIPAVILTACAIGWLGTYVNAGDGVTRRPRVRLAMSVGLVVLLGTTVFLGYRKTHLASVLAQDTFGGGLKAARFLDERRFDGRIGFQGTFARPYLQRIETDASIANFTDKLEQRIVNGNSVVPVLTAAGMSERVARGLADLFNDSDRIAIANARPMAQAGVTRGAFLVPVRPFSDAAAARFGFDLTLEQAAAQLREGKLDALLVSQPIDGLTPLKDFGGAADLRVLLYAKPGSPLADSAPIASQPTTLPTP